MRLCWDALTNLHLLMLTRLAYLTNKCYADKCFLQWTQMLLIRIIMAAFHSGIPMPGPRYYACYGSLARLIGTAKWNAAILNVISHTCAFSAMTSQNVCCEEGVWEIISARSRPHRRFSPRGLGV